MYYWVSYTSVIVTNRTLIQHRIGAEVASQMTWMIRTRKLMTPFYHKDVSAHRQLVSFGGINLDTRQFLLGWLLCDSLSNPMSDQTSFLMAFFPISSYYSWLVASQVLWLIFFSKSLWSIVCREISFLSFPSPQGSFIVAFFYLLL